jgi:C4-dicarboxylate-specific signal transduction histidine kinase
MIDFARNLLSSDFMPHGVCFLWNPGIMWLHAISDAVIALSYYLIPLALVYFVRQRRDVPFHWMFLLFGVFIFACGTTHVMALWTLWHGTYRLEGVIKAVTAAASVGTAVLLVQLLPDALALPSPAQLRAANEDLQREIAHRRRVEHALVEAHDQLEAKVEQRTAELARANDELISEMHRRQAEEAERVRAEETVRQMQAELAHVGRVTVMGELAASIAHEVSQPLAAVVTNANACLRWMASDPPNHAEARDSVNRILRDGHRAGEVLRRIRELLKKSPPKPTEQDVNGLLRDVLALVHDALAKQRIETHVELADVPPVMGDRIQLQQVLLNLVMNGVDAMLERPDGPRSLVVSSRLLDTGEVTMTVQDSGVGVDPAVFDKLFDPFFTTKAEGLGMGLSVSRSIVESHGGHLWASLNEGQGGASFHVSLPGLHA